MQRRLRNTLGWLMLLPLVGTGQLIWHTLRWLGRLRPQTLLMLLGLGVALSLPGPFSEQLAETGIWPMGRSMLVGAMLPLGVLVLYHGLRSRSMRRRWRRLGL